MKPKDNVLLNLRNKRDWNLKSLDSLKILLRIILQLRELLKDLSTNSLRRRVKQMLLAAPTRTSAKMFLNAHQILRVDASMNVISLVI